MTAEIFTILDADTGLLIRKVKPQIDIEEYWDTYKTFTERVYKNNGDVDYIDIYDVTDRDNETGIVHARRRMRR